MKNKVLNLIFRGYQLFFSNSMCYSFNKLIYNLSLRGLGILNYQSDILSGEDCFIRSYVPNISSGVIFDVGANIGNYTKKLRLANQHAKIYSFEPHPVTFQRLVESVAGIDIKLFNVGIGSHGGSLNLYDCAENDGSSHASLFKDVIEKIHNKESIAHQVSIISLDEFVAEHKIDRVGLLKIDTEGYELEVLKGFHEFIKEDRVDVIHFEFNEMNISSRVFFKDFWDLLPNYSFYRMLPDGLVPIKYYSPVFCEIFAYQNIVAKLKVKKSVNDFL